MRPEVTIREGGRLISVHSKALAERVLFPEQKADDSGVCSLAKEMLHKLEVASAGGAPFNGLGAALCGTRFRWAEEDKKIPARIRALNEAAAFWRHFTEIGREAWTREVDAAISRLTPERLHHTAGPAPMDVETTPADRGAKKKRQRRRKKRGAVVAEATATQAAAAAASRAAAAVARGTVVLPAPTHLPPVAVATQAVEPGPSHLTQRVQPPRQRERERSSSRSPRGEDGALPVTAELTEAVAPATAATSPAEAAGGPTGAARLSGQGDQEKIGWLTNAVAWHTQERRQQQRLAAAALAPFEGAPDS
jgi:hypothetical protein